METFTKEYRGNVVVITVNLVSATLNDTNEFKGFMDELLLMTECDVVVDLATCSHLDSTFIGALVLNYKKLKEKKRYMVLVEPNDQTKVFLTMNSLSKIFPLYPSVEVAVEDLLNRNMLEKNLTNQNHNFVVQEQAEEITDDNNSPEEVVNTSSEHLKAELETTDKSNEQDLLTEDINNSIEEKLENEATSPIENYSETSEIVEENVPATNNKINNNELVNESNKEHSLEEEMATVDLATLQSEKFVPENNNKQLVEERDTVDRDYREGTLVWDFGL
jgi:anti-sigma B factor antagonist